MIKRLTPADVTAFWKWLESQPNKWWRQGTPFGPKFGWPQIFAGDNWHCIYCGRDLAESEEVLAESTEEHLGPRLYSPHLAPMRMWATMSPHAVLVATD